MQTEGDLTYDSMAIYKIRIQGYLHESWADRMGGVTIQLENQPDEAPVTVLTGQFQDQAALVGVLSTLYDLGLPLLSVECLGAYQKLEAVSLPSAPPMYTIGQTPRRSPSH
jgi:hypothetical protein